MNARDGVNVGVTTLVVAGVLVASFLRTGWGKDPSAASTPLPTPPAASVPPGAGSTPSTALRLVGGSIDPATVPVRSVDQALFVAEVIGGEGSGLLVVDAATGEWARSDLVSTMDGPLLLSPDGRSLVRAVWSPSSGEVGVETVELGTGTVHQVAVPEPPDCSVDAVAWAPDGRHLGVVSVCATPNVYPKDPKDPTYATVVQEVELATGRTFDIERVPGRTPSETYPSYSPDGRLFAYGISGGTEFEDGESWGAVRVTPVHGGDAHDWDDVHLVYGDPWRDATTLLVWDELADVLGPDSHALLDTTTSTRSPYGIDQLTNLDGFVAGTLLAEQADPCPVTLCSVDLSTGAVAPWLTLPTGMQVVSVSAARSLLAD
ncbi:hypothetical protein DDP54_08210 [Cellulomonas sp. WB94]|uniref:PD40 domain-containing protein n=1 Tax=Cellulomonas sp. WB94 TaxID=2173174 RepID=UPI000D572B3B|nr:PD40 domain-containing protein [Cellulomonas sp. WB94]PVU82989.1 hypothetical protein DDP54_08210 [Cellulomonas sp. WB94]